ncbi:ATP-binding cassette domain-containing protein [Enterococcus hirae]|nr:ATP-binding cassette domain-containing protein [Enterococcaceae bacterium]MCI1918883.1 ATP-binding cassette domain-containing protein [Enterococcaceae bacterium]MDM8213083.1 ATP-binding cassette domain-containing protein [Enterococcus hirae]
MTKVLVLNDLVKTVQNGGVEAFNILDHLSLTVDKGDFITVLGGNGAGKSTMFNAIAGTLKVDSGSIALNDQPITKDSEEKRAKYISRVFQDPKMGTAPRMTVAENLLLAETRGKHRNLKNRHLKAKLAQYKKLTATISNGLEDHLNTPTGNLSGGQRQALSLLMATILKPQLLMLDEHTAALDPKTSKQLMALTAQTIERDQLTCLMITHRMEDALKYGNRLILIEKGKVKMDLRGEEKRKLTMKDVLEFFEENEND